MENRLQLTVEHSRIAGVEIGRRGPRWDVVSASRPEGRRMITASVRDRFGLTSRVVERQQVSDVGIGRTLRQFGEHVQQVCVRFDVAGAASQHQAIDHRARLGTGKALECLDLIGWDHAPALLPTIVGQMVAARGAEESTAWRQPVDLVALCEESASQMPELFAAARTLRGWSRHAALARELLGDDPAKIIDALKAAIRAGAAPADLGRSLAYGAALRVARFGNANEHADWDTAHHVFTYANAVHQMLRRIGTADIDGRSEERRVGK